MLEGTSVSLQSSLLLTEVRPDCSVWCPGKSWLPSGLETEQPPWAAYFPAQLSSCEKKSSLDSVSFSLHVLSLLISPCTTVKNETPSPCSPPHRHWGLLLGVPKAISSPGWTSCDPQCLVTGQMLQSQPLWWPSTAHSNFLYWGVQKWLQYF